MAANWTIIRVLGRYLGDLTAFDKWRAARAPFAGPGGAGAWVLMGLAVLGVAAVAALAAVLYSHQRQRKLHREFQGRAETFGLSGKERTLLLSLTRALALKRPASVFTMPEAFERGAAGTLNNGRLAAMPEAKRQETVSMLGSLREKLGFGNAPEGRKPTAISVGKIPAGKTLSIFRPHRQDQFNATVSAVPAGSSELAVTPEIPVPCGAGETWQVRYSQEGLLWEWNASVARRIADRVVLKLTGPARCVNRRRFARIPSSLSAFVAAYPFLEDARDAEPPAFVPATLIELAGPGLRLETPLQAKVGEKVLVRVQTPQGSVLQGLALVRRATGLADGLTDLGTEMIGLTTSEVAELIRQTNLAARVGEAEPTGASGRGG